MTEPRTRLVVMRELYSAGNEIARLERQIQNDPNKDNVAIAERCLAAARKREAALEAELAGIPDVDVGLRRIDPLTHIRFGLRSHYPGAAPYDDDPLLDIPEFLRRT